MSVKSRYSGLTVQALIAKRIQLCRNFTFNHLERQRLCALEDLEGAQRSEAQRAIDFLNRIDATQLRELFEVDAALAAYRRSSLSCLGCHRALKESEVAGGEDLPALQPTQPTILAQ